MQIFKYFVVLYLNMVRCLVCEKEVMKVVKSRLSPDSYLRHDKDFGYTLHAYCETCHLDILSQLWLRLKSVSVQDSNPAPTAI